MKRTFLLLTISIVCFLFPSLTYSQSFLQNGGNPKETFGFASKQAEVWALARDRTLEVAKAMPEEFYSYQPTPDVKSFGQQMAHIANSMRSMNNRFILGSRYDDFEKDASKVSKSELIEDLESAFNEVISTLVSMNDRSLQAAGKQHGAFPLTKWQSFLFMQDHVTNHRAKAVLYLRLKGIDPPDYGYN